MSQELDKAQQKHRFAMRRLELLENENTRPEHWIAALEELYEASKGVKLEHKRIGKVIDGGFRAWNRAEGVVEH